jgi:hypothetical protein
LNNSEDLLRAEGVDPSLSQEERKEESEAHHEL